MEMADFPLSELDLPLTTLAALKMAGYNTFLDIIDLEREDFARIEGLTENDVNRIISMIDELTVVEGESSDDQQASAASARDDSGGNGESGGGL